MERVIHLGVFSNIVISLNIVKLRCLTSRVKKTLFIVR